MKKIRTAVIGVGYLGRFHAQKYATLPESTLVAVCDIDSQRGHEIAAELGIDAVSDYQSLIGRVDAVSIVTPTLLHYPVGKFFLEQGVHVLMEKPITSTSNEAQELIDIAKKNEVILQVGHLERFNSVYKALDPILLNPLYIESSRLAPFKLRGSEVNVILDLMIHDIDLILSIIKSDISDIRASGTPILSPFIDIANARLEFKNGCVANVKASRVANNVERTLRVFQHDSFIDLDFDAKQMSVHRKGTQEMFPGIPDILHEQQSFEKGDALKDQIHSFLNCIIEQKPPIVSGEDGKYALDVAILITETIRKQIEHFQMVMNRNVQ